MATDNGSVTSGDTGRGKMIGQGFTSAGIRAKTDQTMIKACDRQVLKVILKICRDVPESEIKDLRVSDVDIKFNIDKSENLLTKSEALNILISMGVPKEYAVPIVNLFGDPTAVVTAWNKIEEETEEEQKQNANPNQEVQELNNNVNNLMQKNTQEK